MKQAQSTDTANKALLRPNTLEKNERYYLDLREKLQKYGHLLGKYRKTMKAAETEAAMTNEEWKAALRASEGDISKTVRDLKSREIAARETAEEFATLVAETEPEFKDLQAVTCMARRNYINAFDQAERAKNLARLEETAKAVFSTEQGQELLALFSHHTKQIKADCATDSTIQMMAQVAPQSASMSVAEAENDIITRRVQGFVFDLIHRHSKTLGDFTNFAIINLSIAAGAYELGHTQAQIITASKAASRLKAAGIIA